MKNNKKLTAEWFKKAEEDKMSIKAILKENGAPSTACFLSQQMAEKYLKGFLIFKENNAPKTHDLRALFNLIKKIESNIIKLEDDVTLLNQYYIATRYPADLPDGFSLSMAKEAFKAAQKIKNWTLGKII